MYFPFFPFEAGVGVVAATDVAAALPAVSLGVPGVGVTMVIIGIAVFVGAAVGDAVKLPDGPQPERAIRLAIIANAARLGTLPVFEPGRRFHFLVCPLIRRADRFISANWRRLRSIHWLTEQVSFQLTSGQFWNTQVGFGGALRH